MMNIPHALDFWYLTGPTASGKTQIGIRLAARIGAEIISLDSMSIYRGMDIGTAKPSAAQRAEVPHHLIDIRDPDQQFSVSDYLELVAPLTRQIEQRGNRVLFVGGTPMWLKALLRGMFEGPPADEAFRREVLAEAQAIGGDALHQRLQLVDPLSAAKLHPHDVRRIIRALEVHRQTGQPISHQQLQFDEGVEAEHCRVFVLDWPRPLLHQRINQRVEQMFAAGLVDEVRRVIDRYGQMSRTALQAVGYREVLSHLQSGVPLDQVIRRTQARTRQFAKRQITWFRSLSECRWIPMRDDHDVDELVAGIVDQGHA